MGEPAWRAISALLAIATLIDERLRDARQQHATLLDAQPDPRILQAATIARLTHVNDSLASCTVYERQLRRWHTQRPTGDQQLELARLQHAAGQLRMLLTEIRALADDLTAATIASQLNRTTATRGLGATPSSHPQR